MIHTRKKTGLQIRLHVMCLAGLCVVLTAFLSACGRKQPSSLDPDMARLVAENRALAKQMAAGETNPIPSGYWKVFDLLERDDWQSASNTFRRLEEQRQNRSTIHKVEALTRIWNQIRGFLRLPGPGLNALDEAMWTPLHETFGVALTYHEWDRQLLRGYGHDIIESIPPHSIYFGGTDSGRFIITAMSKSHRKGDPFYTITQNALADHRYLDSLQFIYGPGIYIPTATDAQNAFSTYIQAASQRQSSGTLKPGENMTNTNGRITISGQTAVMEINGLLVKVIFDRNTNCEFFIEESYPLDWMYPHLSPHGLILKLNRTPMPELPQAVCREDHEYWQRYTGQLLGCWITDQTTVKEVCDFAERVYLKRNLEGYTGDRAFAQNEAVQKSFSKLRGSIAGIYAWRGEHGSADEKARMQQEADFAFRQALALCPVGDSVERYVDFLLTQHRPQDALLVAQTGLRLDPKNARFGLLVDNLKKTP